MDVVRAVKGVVAVTLAAECSLFHRSSPGECQKIRRTQQGMTLLNQRPTAARHPVSVHRQRYRWVTWWARQHPQLYDTKALVTAWKMMEQVMLLG